MEQQQPQQQQQRSHPSSPVRVGGSGSGVGGAVVGGGGGTTGDRVAPASSWNSSSANASASSGSGDSNNTTMAANVDVTRSISMESGGANSIATYGSGSVATTTTGRGGNNSLRASPVPSYRATSSSTTPMRNSPSLAISDSAASAANANTIATTSRGMPPPPWPTTTTASAMPMSTPQRSTVIPSADAVAVSQPSTTGMVGFPPLTPPPLVNMTHSSSTATSSNNNNNNNNLSVNLSITKSGDSLFSSSQGGGSGGGPAGTMVNDSNIHVQQQQQQQQQQAAVLLGLEELERQQAGVEKRREQQQEEQQRRLLVEQQKLAAAAAAAAAAHSQPPGLPPLAPPQQYHHHRHGSGGGGGGGVATALPHHQDVVPSQIHLDNELNDDEEDTLMSSDGLGGGGGAGTGAAVGPGVLKRVVSIEKLRGSVNSRLQRLRSWSQDALHRSYVVDPATGSSVDSTQPATLTTEEGGGTGIGGGQYKMDPAVSNNSGLLVGSSSTATITFHSQQHHRQGNAKSSKRMMLPNSSSFTSNKNDIIPEPYLDEGEIKPLVYGYLYKLGRNGHWQRRFFETNGERLTYYKNVKRNTVLATLDLCKVGEIAIDETDPDGCTFTIQVKNRPYYLRAADKARCNDWVIILNRAREARMQVGNIQLATATTNSQLHGVGVGGSSLVDNSVYRSQTGSDDYSQPCIVISALRPRTRALMNFEEGEEDTNLQNFPVPDLLTSNTAQDEEQIEATTWDTKPSPLALQQHQHGVVGVVGSDDVAHSTGGSGVGGGVATTIDDDDDIQSMAKWQKRHSTWHVLSVRFLRWARSITHHADACRRENDVMVVPSHVVMASQQQQLQQSSRRAPGAGEGGGEARPGQKKSTPLPDLMDSTPVTPGAGADSDNHTTHERARANTESPAFGITYV